MLEDERDDGPAQNREAHRRRNTEQKNQSQRVGQSAAEFDIIRLRAAARKRRQCRRGDGHAKHADGKLNETKSVAQPRNRAVGYGAGGGSDNRGRKISVDKNIDLHGSSTDNRRSHQAEDLANTRIADTDHGPIAESGADKARPLDGEL